MEAMGIGKLGDSKIIIKRKFRWTLGIETPLGKIPESYCKVASRPNLEIDETEINFLNATTWIPGKGKWQPLSVTYIDIAKDDLMPLYDWVTSLYDFSSSEGAEVALKNTEKEGWNATATLKMFDGCGNQLEMWQLKSCWPQSINFGDLDYSSSDEATIELSLRYSGVVYYNSCGREPAPSCKGCG
jgi:hypothetical protein